MTWTVETPITVKADGSCSVELIVVPARTPGAGASGALAKLSVLNERGQVKVKTGEYSLEELRKMKDSKFCVVGLFGKVYNLDKFLSKHPGGERALLGASGDIIDDVFEDGNHRSLKGKVAGMLAQYEVGTLKI